MPCASGARFGVLRLDEGRVPSRDYVGRGKVPVAGKRGVEVGRRLVGRRRAGRATLIWSTSMSPDQKRAFLNYPIEYNRIIIVELKFSICHNTDHRGPIISSFINQTAIVLFFIPQVNNFLKIRSKHSLHVFSVIDLTSMDTMNYKNFDF